MSAFIYISGVGQISNFGSLKSKAAATALEKKIGKRTAKNFAEKDADILRGVGGMTPGDSDGELRVLNENGKVLFSIDDLFELPERCFIHRFIKIDPEEHPFVWRNDVVSTYGDFFLYEDEDGDFDDSSDESDFLPYFKEYLRIQVTHVFFGDVEVTNFVDGAKFGKNDWFKDVESWDPEHLDEEDREDYDVRDNFPMPFTPIEKERGSFLRVYKEEPLKTVSV